MKRTERVQNRFQKDTWSSTKLGGPMAVGRPDLSSSEKDTLVPRDTRNLPLCMQIGHRQQDSQHMEGNWLSPTEKETTS